MKLLKPYSTALFLLLVIASCSKNDQKPSYKIDNATPTIHYDETHQFAVTQGTTSIDNSTLTWSSSDESVGKINTKGYFTAKKIGTTTIKGTATGINVQSVVTVTPYSTLCIEPYFTADASMATTKTAEKRKLLETTDTYLFYAGENAKLRNVIYLYNTDKMTAAGLVLSNSDVVIAEAENFFKERYTLESSEDGVFYFFDLKSVVVAVSINDNIGFNALYFKYTGQVVNMVKTKNFKALNAIRVT